MIKYGLQIIFRAILFELSGAQGEALSEAK